MRLLVVGGAGYIGSHTVYELIRAGHDVVVMDNLSTGSMAMVHPDAGFVKGDVTLKDDVKNALSKGPFDVVMHFAAKIVVPESVSDPLSYYHNNVEGVRVLLEGMKEAGTKKIVFSSTAAVYGEANGVCVEESPTVPINPYGETKLACEKMIRWVSEAEGFSYVIFRYFNVAGADASGKIGLLHDHITHLIPVAIQAALGMRDHLSVFGTDYPTEDGTCIRDYIHVTDLAKAHVLGAAHLMAGGTSETMNLGSNKGFSVLEVAREVDKVAPLKTVMDARRPGDPAVLVASNDKAGKVLGWKPERSLSDIVRSDLAFRKSHR
jgi:UDP-glucose 4-epimerase